MRGKGVEKLPAVIRALAETHCAGEDIPRFWSLLGFQRDHEMLKEGLLYSIDLEGHSLQVVLLLPYGACSGLGFELPNSFLQVEVVNLSKLDRWGDVSSAIVVAAEQWAVVVRVKAADVEGSYVSASQAIGKPLNLSFNHWRWQRS